MIQYTEEKKFTQKQVKELFLSVGWVSGQYPERLYQALMHSSTVFTVWSKDQLVGLLRVLDDGLCSLCIGQSKISGTGDCRSFGKLNERKICRLFLY